MTSQQQPFPRLGTEFVSKDLRIGIPWYRLLITLWQRTGGSLVPTTGTVVLNNTVGGIQAVDALTGTVLGYVFLGSASGGPAVPLAVGASPFVYQALGPGTIVVTGGQVEVSRNGGGTWYLVTLNGGAVPMVTNDKVRVTWYDNTNPPVATFFPSTV